MSDRALQVVDQATGVLTRADEWNQRRIDFVRNTYCGGAPDAEASAFIEICKRRGLSPEEKQVYFIKRRSKKDDGKWEEVWTIQTGIDGYRLMADRTGRYAGSDDAVFEGESSFSTGKDDWQKEVIHPLVAAVTVWKIVDGLRCPFTASARWSEYYPGEKQGKFWHNMPYTMLGKCAESLALRKAFPADLSGIYTHEEMGQAEQYNGNPAEAQIVEHSPARLPAVPRKKLTDKQFGAEVRKAMAARDAGAFRTLVDDADRQVGRWIALVQAAESPQALDWIKRQIERKGVGNDLLEHEIRKREEQITGDNRTEPAALATKEQIQTIYDTGHALGMSDAEILTYIGRPENELSGDEAEQIRKELNDDLEKRIREDEGLPADFDGDDSGEPVGDK